MVTYEGNYPKYLMDKEREALHAEELAMETYLEEKREEDINMNIVKIGENRVVLEITNKVNGLLEQGGVCGKYISISREDFDKYYYATPSSSPIQTLLYHLPGIKQHIIRRGVKIL